MALAHPSAIAAAFKSGELVDSATVKEAKNCPRRGGRRRKGALHCAASFSPLVFARVKMVQRELNLEERQGPQGTSWFGALPRRATRQT